MSVKNWCYERILVCENVNCYFSREQFRGVTFSSSRISISKVWDNKSCSPHLWEGALCILSLFRKLINSSRQSESAKLSGLRPFERETLRENPFGWMSLFPSCDVSWRFSISFYDPSPFAKWSLLPEWNHLIRENDPDEILALSHYRMRSLSQKSSPAFRTKSRKPWKKLWKLKDQFRAKTRFKLCLRSAEKNGGNFKFAILRNWTDIGSHPWHDPFVSCCTSTRSN